MYDIKMALEEHLSLDFILHVLYGYPVVTDCLKTPKEYFIEVQKLMEQRLAQL